MFAYIEYINDNKFRFVCSDVPNFMPYSLQTNIDIVFEVSYDGAAPVYTLVSDNICEQSGTFEIKVIGPLTTKTYSDLGKFLNKILRPFHIYDIIENCPTYELENHCAEYHSIVD
jgi:hypothetical protein